MAAVAGGEDDPDFHSYSLRPYEQEFLEHPDLVATWAVDEAFLARFAEGFEAYRRGAHVLAHAPHPQPPAVRLGCKLLLCRTTTRSILLYGRHFTTGSIAPACLACHSSVLGMCGMHVHLCCSPDLRFEPGRCCRRAGDWGAARIVLAETRGSRRDDAGSVVVDGPSATLLGFMEGHEFSAPATWRGFRELTEK